jgi:hypothetical protein
MYGLQHKKDGSWRWVGPVGGNVYEYGHEVEATCMLNILYPDELRAERLGAPQEVRVHPIMWRPKPMNPRHPVLAHKLSIVAARRRVKEKREARINESGIANKVADEFKAKMHKGEFKGSNIWLIVKMAAIRVMELQSIENATIRKES